MSILGTTDLPLDYQLHRAIEVGTVEEVTRLLALGANPNLPNMSTDFSWVRASPIATAIDSGDAQKLHAVLRAGGDVKVVESDMFRYYPPNRANAFHHLVNAVVRDRCLGPPMGTALLKYGCDVNGADSLGLVPLHLAAEAGLVGLCEFLLDNGAKIDASCPCPWRRRPLDLCAVAGSQETFTLLVSRGAPIVVGPNNPYAPLHLVAIYGSRELMLLFLIGLGLDVNERSSAGTSPLDLVPTCGAKYMNAIYAFVAAGAVASRKMLKIHLPKSRIGRAIREHRLRAAILSGCPNMVSHTLASLSVEECLPYLKSSLLKADFNRKEGLAALQLRAVLCDYEARLVMEEL